MFAGFKVYTCIYQRTFYRGQFQRGQKRADYDPGYAIYRKVLGVFHLNSNGSRLGMFLGNKRYIVGFDWKRQCEVTNTILTLALTSKELVWRLIQCNGAKLYHHFISHASKITASSPWGQYVKRTILHSNSIWILSLPMRCGTNMSWYQSDGAFYI